MKSAISIQHLEEALRKSGGLCAGAAQLLGVTRQAVSRRVQKSPKLQAVIKEVEESSLDLGESKLLQAMNKGNMAAIIFYLKTKGKSRGYVERSEVTGKDGNDLPTGTQIILYMPDNGRPNRQAD